MRRVSGISRLLRAAKLQSVPDADNPRYAAVLTSVTVNKQCGTGKPNICFGFIGDKGAGKFKVWHIPFIYFIKTASILATVLPLHSSTL